VIVPEVSALPVDPASEVPPGFTADQRGAAGGFVGEVDIMDTWATSSLTPQLAGSTGSADTSGTITSSKRGFPSSSRRYQTGIGTPK
jgi:hypothetical protein